MTKAKLINGELSCPDCEVKLTGDIGVCPCGWRSTEKADNKIKQAEQHSVDRTMEIIGDKLPDSMKTIENFKKKYGDDWQSKLSQVMSEKLDKGMKEKDKKKKADRAQYKKQWSEQQTQEEEDLQNVLDCMPAPHDSIGLMEYEVNLRKIQHLLPTEDDEDRH